MKETTLSPLHLLDSVWAISEIIPNPPRAKIVRGEKTQEEQLLDAIRATRITIAENSNTVVLSKDAKYEYLKSDLGMNIILPRGRIKEIRFRIALRGDDGTANGINAIDGFPKDQIDEKYILEGKIKLGVSKVFKFIPIVGDIMADLLEIEINPWEFKLGSIRKINVDFSGGNTATPEWYFRENGIKNDLAVTLTIKKSKKIKQISADINVAWDYDPGFLKPRKVGSDVQSIKISY